MRGTKVVIVVALILAVTLNLSSCASLKRVTGWRTTSSDSAHEPQQERRVPLPPMVEDFEPQRLGGPEGAR